MARRDANATLDDLRGAVTTLEVDTDRRRPAAASTPTGLRKFASRASHARYRRRVAQGTSSYKPARRPPHFLFFGTRPASSSPSSAGAAASSAVYSRRRRARAGRARALLRPSTSALEGTQHRIHEVGLLEQPVQAREVPLDTRHAPLSSAFSRVLAPCALINARNARCAMGARALAFQSTIAVRSF